MIKEILETYKEKIPTNEMLFLCSTENPSPIAYFNVYEEGDIWVKIKGCEECPVEKRRICCGKCPMFSDLGCYWHLESRRGSNKPFYCITFPHPGKCMSHCQLQYKCIEGSKKDKIRRICNKGNIFE